MIYVVYVIIMIYYVVNINSRHRFIIHIVKFVVKNEMTILKNKNKETKKAIIKC